MSEPLVRRYMRYMKEKHDIFAEQRAEAILRGHAMAMLNESNEVIIVTDMSENAFRDFLLAGDRDPRMTADIKKTPLSGDNYVSTMFLGMSLEPGKWYETYRHSDCEIIRSVTEKEALEEHQKLVEGQ